MSQIYNLAHWLATKEKDYAQGVEIFTSLKVDPGKNKFFNTNSPGKIHQNMLRKELERYARINNVKPRLQVAPKKVSNTNITEGKKNTAIATTTSKQGSGGKTIQRPKIDKNPVVDYKSLPKNLQVKFDQNGKLNSEIKTYHAEFKQIIDDPEKKERRAELAKHLVGNRAKMRANWDEIDSWWKEKQNKTPEQLAADQALAKQNRIRANLNYIRRNYLSEDPKKKEELNLRMQELDKWEVDYEELVERIKASEK